MDCYGNQSGPMMIRHKSTSTCFKFFNDPANLEQRRVTGITYWSETHEKLRFIYHPHHTSTLPDTPSHFYEAKGITLRKHKKNLLTFVEKKSVLLSSPYSTDCYDYTDNIRSNVRPKSPTDCKLEYMRRKELEICGNKNSFDKSKHLLLYVSRQ